jgi:hypothetical protein
LTTDDRCSIHAPAPFGCAFFDVHMATGEADARSSFGLRAVLADWLAGGPYSQLWRALDVEGLRAPLPEEGRARLNQERLKRSPS